MKNKKIRIILGVVLVSMLISFTGYGTYKVNKAKEEMSVSQEVFKNLGSREEVPFPKEPMITGIILERTYTNELLVVADDHDEFPDAMRVSFETHAQVVNTMGENIPFLDLKVGMKVSCYGRGMINDTYPQQASCEKVVVDETYVIPKLYEVMDIATATRLYGSGELSKGYPFIGLSQNTKFIIPFKNDSDYEMSFTMMMDDAYVYYNLRGDEPKVECYEGKLSIYTKKDGQIIENPYNINHVILRKDYEPKFVETDEGLAFTIASVIDGELVNTVLLMNKEGKLLNKGLVEELSFVNDDYNYSITGNSLTDDYYFVDHDGKELALVPDELVEIFKEDKEAIKSMRLEYYYKDMTLVYEGQLFVYKYSEKLWREVIVDGYVEFANYDGNSIYDLYVKDGGGMDYSYDWNKDQVITRLRIGTSYMNRGIAWDGKLYINYIHQVGEDVDPLVFFDQDLSHNSFLEVTIGDNEYKVIDSFEYKGKVYFIDGNKYQVLDGDTGEIVLDASVGNYSYSDGLLAYEDKELGEWYYLDFSTMEKHLLYEGELPIVKTYKGDIGMVDMEGNVTIISGETGLELHAFYVRNVITELFAAEVLFDFDKERIYINVGTTYVIDRESMDIVDQFITREIHITEDGRLFYTALGSLFEYDPDSKTHVPIAINNYCVYVTSFKDSLIVYHGIDGPGSYGVYDMDDSWYNTKSGNGLNKYDYILFYQVNEYGSRLFLLDNINEKLEYLTSSDGMINYYVEEDKILYQPLIRGLYGEIQKPNGELIEYKLEEGRSVYIYDFNVASYYEYFTHNVEDGYVLENEFYNFDQGKFLVMTDPIYNNGLFDEKTLGVYVHGAHQKGYTLLIEGFRLPQRANMYMVEVNEERNMILIAYDIDGEKYGAYFEVDLDDFRVRHIETIQFVEFENEDQAIDYLRSQIN